LPHETPRRTNRRVTGFPNTATVSVEHADAILPPPVACAPVLVSASTMMRATVVSPSPVRICFTGRMTVPLVVLGGLDWEGDERLVSAGAVHRHPIGARITQPAALAPPGTTSSATTETAIANPRPAHIMRIGP
jgi:hypothetical protein